MYFILFHFMQVKADVNSRWYAYKNLHVNGIQVRFLIISIRMLKMNI